MNKQKLSLIALFILFTLSQISFWVMFIFLLAHIGGTGQLPDLVDNFITYVGLICGFWGAVIIIPLLVEEHQKLKTKE